jgi:hypothetical protein
MSVLAEVFREPTLAGVCRELAVLAAPLWLAALVGLLVGWAWRPRWVPAAVAPHDTPAPPLPPPPKAADNSAALVPR